MLLVQQLASKGSRKTIWQHLVNTVGLPSGRLCCAGYSIAGKHHATKLFCRRLRYAGPIGVTPPESLTLLRGTRNWVGSYDEAWLVAALGRALDDAVQGLPAPSQEDTGVLDEQL